MVGDGQLPAGSDLVVDDAGVARCPWGASGDDYRAYHDTEWGRPVIDDRAVLERLCLEGFQSGLSWLTILRKRDGFRSAFARFDPEQVARFGPDDVSRLLHDSSIVRHRGKIEATINNARRLLDMWEGGESLAGLVWSFRSDDDGPMRLADVPAVTAESKALASELKQRGFRFVGPTTAYAAMQAMGVVNDHLIGCVAREPCRRLRSDLDHPGDVSREDKPR